MRMGSERVGWLGRLLHVLNHALHEGEIDLFYWILEEEEFDDWKERGRRMGLEIRDMGICL